MVEKNLEQFLDKRGYISIQMARSNVGHFEVRTELNGQELVMLVDTGASKTVLHSETAEKKGISSSASENCGGGLGTSNAKVSTAKIETFKIGELKINNFQLFIMDFSHAIKSIEAKGGTTICGVVGADILGPRSAIIDYEEAKLYLKK